MPPKPFSIAVYRASSPVFGDRHVIVTVTVTEETPYLSGLLADVMVMTLMTLIYGLILDRECISIS
jgi:hypothetical protein